MLLISANMTLAGMGELCSLCRRCAKTCFAFHERDTVRCSLTNCWKGGVICSCVEAVAHKLWADALLERVRLVHISDL